MRMFIAVDIGGTKTLVAVLNQDGDIHEKHKFPTPHNYSDFKESLAHSATVLATKNYKAGAVGIRGKIDRDAGFSLLDDILPWGKVPVRDDCEAIFGCSFKLENDSKLAGLSEAKQVYPDFKRVLYITISTGIGSSFIVDGELDKNTINSEIGKGIYEHDGRFQQWEDFASGKAIVAKYNQQASELEDAEAWRSISKNIAVGLIDAILVFSPEIVIFGGGVGAHFSKFERPLLEIIKKLEPLEMTIPVICQAKRPEEAVIYGCYELINQHRAKHT